MYWHIAQVHVATLAGALGASAVGEAKYKFGVTDAKSFVSLANVLEGVGVSAYLGAAAAIVDSMFISGRLLSWTQLTLRTETYLTVAGSILTVEARHSSYIRSKLAQSPFPKPFDTPLDFKQVYSLAAQFITAFPSGSSGLPADPFSPFPAITIEPSRYNYTAGGSPVTFSGAFTNAKAAGLVADANTPVYAVFFSGLDIYYVKARITSTNKDYKIDQIPAGAVGQVYVVLSTADGVNGNKVRDENTISGVGVLEVQPKSYPSVFSG